MLEKDQVGQMLDRPAITPTEALGLLPISRNALYGALRAGEIDSFRIGKKILIRTASLRRKLGMEV
jgi:hypothetical protein